MLAKRGGPSFSCLQKGVGQRKLCTTLGKNPVKISIKTLKIYIKKSLYILLRPKDCSS
jgi:hypothetical protein